MYKVKTAQSDVRVTQWRTTSPSPPIMHRSLVPMSLKDMLVVKTRHKLVKMEIWCFLQKVK